MTCFDWSRSQIPVTLGLTALQIEYGASGQFMYWNIIYNCGMQLLNMAGLCKATRLLALGIPCSLCVLVPGLDPPPGLGHPLQSLCTGTGA
jgi:hypothetical protein